MIGVGGKQFEMAKEMMQHVGRQNSVKGRSYIDAQGLHTADGLHLALSPDGADPGGAQTGRSAAASVSRSPRT